MIHAWLICVVVISQAADPPREGKPAASSPAGNAAAILPPAQLAELIADLGSPDWNLRQAATDELCGAGEAAYAALKAEFRRTHNHEVKRRIRTVVEQIYFYSATNSRGGFLGISHQAVTRSDFMPQIPLGEMWVQIASVVPGSAAQRAGLQAGDLICAVDGRRMKVNDPQAFADWIGMQPPGTRVKLSVSRFGQVLELEAVLGRRKMGNFNVFGVIAREQKMIDARNRFSSWWRREFDPKGEADESAPVSNDPAWTLEPHGG